MNTDTINKFFAAAKEGNHKNVELYLNQGVPIDVINANGMDALYIALKHGHDNVIKLLLNRGASLGSDKESIEHNIAEILLQSPQQKVKLLGCFEGDTKENFLQEGIDYDVENKKLVDDAAYKMNHFEDLNVRQSIPFKTHQMWFSLDQEMDALSVKICLATAKSLNKANDSFQHNYWTNNPDLIPTEIKKISNVKIRSIDELQDSILWPEFSRTLKAAETDKMMFAAASDIFRLMVIQKEGGTYRDLDNQFYNSKEYMKMLKSFDFIGGKESPKEVSIVTNFFLAASPNHPVINTAVDLAKRNLNQDQSNLPEYIKFPCTKSSNITYKAGGPVISTAYFLSANQGGYVDVVAPYYVFSNYQYAWHTNPESKCYDPNKIAYLTNYVNGTKIKTISADMCCGSWSLNGKFSNILYNNKNINLYLFEAAKYGYASIAKYLIDNGANIEEISITGATSLYISAQKGHIETAQVFLEAGANIESKAINNLTPLGGALLNKHYDVVNLLMEYGANVESIDLVNKISLIEAAGLGYVKIVEFLLAKGNYIDEINELGATAIYMAVQNGHLKTVEFLVKAGANLNIAIAKGTTPLYKAVEKGYSDIVDLLLQYKANTEIKHSSGTTALGLAVYFGHEKIVEMLLKHGADREVSVNGITLRQLAQEKSNGHIIKLLSEDNPKPEIVSIIKNILETHCDREAAIEELCSFSKVFTKDLDFSGICKIKGEVDKIFVINLDRSTSRMTQMDKQLKDIGLEYQRFSAIDGYKVKITNLLTSQEFLGIDIKNKQVTIKKDVMYKITCNPEFSVPTEFKFLGSVAGAYKISAGELGLWCTERMIWEEADKNGYKKIIIFEDDILFKGQNFKQDLSNFVNHVPETFDFAYLDLLLKSGNQHALPNNQYINMISSDATGWGSYAMMFSAKSIKTLLSAEHYTHPLDLFFWCLSTGVISFPGTERSEECMNYKIPLEVYGSSIDLLDTVLTNSEISLMGR